MGEPIRVLIVDDHPVYRDGLRGLVERAPDLELVGEAENGVAAVTLAAERHPTIVLMDLRMPEMSGIEATRRIVGTDPTVGVLVLTMSEDDDSLFAAMRAGARGYLPKDADSEELIRAIRAAALGEVIFGASIASRWPISAFERPAAICSRISSSRSVSSGKAAAERAPPAKNDIRRVAIEAPKIASPRAAARIAPSNSSASASLGM